MALSEKWYRKTLSLQATDFPPSDCNHQQIWISRDLSREPLGQKAGGEEKKLPDENPRAVDVVQSHS